MGAKVIKVWLRIENCSDWGDGSVNKAPCLTNMRI